MKSSLIFLTFCIIYFISCAKNGPTSNENNTSTPLDSSLLYLGQTPPGTQFVRFAPNIIPEEMIHSVTLSPDGQEIYWAERNGIKVTKISNGSWTTPEFVSFSGNSGQDFYDDAPVISPDNTKLFFNSRRPCIYNTGTGWSFWYVERTTTGWSEPQPLPDVINSTGGMHFQVSVSDSGALYFGVNSGTSVGIYYSRLVNGTYTTPQPLNVLNNFGDVICPFIALDESYIIFNKVENGLSAGYFISFKGGNNQWLTPQRLNQFPGEESAFVTRDGRFIFCKAFWASAQIIEDLRPDSTHSNTVTDFEGNIYSTVNIGNQCWMAENLKTTHKADGSVLNSVYAYNDDENNVAEYGRLYNWQAALDAEIPGWHLPSDAEWDILINMVGSNPADKLRNGGSSGFNAKLGGRRLESGEYGYLGTVGIYWTSLQTDPTHGRVKLFADGESNVITDNTPIAGGKSVRYIKD